MFFLTGCLNYRHKAIQKKQFCKKIVILKEKIEDKVSKQVNLPKKGITTINQGFPNFFFQIIKETIKLKRLFPTPTTTI